MTADLAGEVARLRWYHRMALPGGVVTPGVNDAARIMSRLRLPASLAGRSVLDVGAWDGFYSFESARRGAARVLATDSFVWSGQTWGSQQGFLLARRALGLEHRVEDRLVDVMDLDPQTVGGRFDLVLLLGVLYHLRDPVTALERVASVCADLLVLETETALNKLRTPAAAVFPGRELNGDESNWYAYNVAALRGLLARVGFTDVEVVWRTSAPRRVGRALSRSRAGPAAVRSAWRPQRVVLHARRG